MKIFVLILSLSFSSGVFALSIESLPEPKVSILEAVRVASEFLENSGDKVGRHIHRVWWHDAADDENDRWVIAWVPTSSHAADEKIKVVGWVFVSVFEDGVAQSGNSNRKEMPSESEE